MKSPRLSRRSTAATVPAKRGSSAARNPSSESNSRLAASSRPPKLSTKVFSAASQARSPITRCIASACVRQYSARAGSFRCCATRASRSHAPAQLPDTGVGLVVDGACDLAQGLETVKQGFVARAIEARVEEHVGRREHRRTVHVVLHLLVRGVTHPHGPHAAEPRQRRYRGLLEIGGAAP